jgi:ParB-like chromosome segregation protein Spo0J
MAGVLDQSYRTVTLAQVQPHPANPRRGDVAAIGESIESNGFFGALVVQQSTGFILVGNHRYEAAKLHGLSELPALVIDVDDDQAKRILLADNRYAELAKWDEDALAAILRELDLTGTGFTDEDLAAMVTADDFEPDDADMSRLDQRAPTTCPACGFSWRIDGQGEIEPAAP